MEILVVLQLFSEKMDTMNRVQILDEAICISLHTNSLGKGMNPLFPSPARSKQ